MAKTTNTNENGNCANRVLCTGDLEKLANKCLHCGEKPTCYHTDYFGDNYVGDNFMFECKCGIQTGWFDSKELLQIWNSSCA